MGGVLVTTLRLPLYLDTIGTILVAVLAGPWVGALTGIITNARRLRALNQFQRR